MLAGDGNCSTHEVTIGPNIEDGFYDFARNEPFTPEDFANSENGEVLAW